MQQTDLELAGFFAQLREVLLKLDKDQWHASREYESSRDELKKKLAPFSFRLSKDGFGHHCIVPMYLPHLYQQKNE